MQYSPPIPFEQATQNNIKHPNALKPGQEFVRLTMYCGEKDPVPSWPWPTYTWGVVYDTTHYSLHGASPAVAGYTFVPPQAPVSSDTNCKDWFQLGAYTIVVGPTNLWTLVDNPGGGWTLGGLSYGSPPNTTTGQLYGNNVIAWSAPGVMATLDVTYYPGTGYALTQPTRASSYQPTAWEVDWIIETTLYPNGFGHATVELYNRYYTGAGSEDLANVTTLRYAVVNGMTAVLFDDDGIGYLSYTGDWQIPFNYQRRASGYVTCGWPINVNGWVYFVDKGGKLFRTDGSYVLEVGGGYSPGTQVSTALFNALMIPEIVSLGHTWPDTLANAENWMQFDQTLHRLVFNIKYLDSTVKSAGLAMIELNSGGFQFLPDATNISADAAIPRVETGGIKLVDPADRTHIAYVDVDFEIIGDPTALTQVPGAAINLTSQGNPYQKLTGPGGVWKYILPAWVHPDTDTIGVVGLWSDGTALIYTAGPGPAIGGLVDGTTYYVINVGGGITLSDTLVITSGTSLTVAATEAFTGSMVDGPPTYILASGRQVIRCWVNKLVEKIPRIRITLNDPPANIKCRIWGIHRIAFDKGGSLP